MKTIAVLCLLFLTTAYALPLLKTEDEETGKAVEKADIETYDDNFETAYPDDEAFLQYKKSDKFSEKDEEANNNGILNEGVEDNEVDLFNEDDENEDDLALENENDRDIDVNFGQGNVLNNDNTNTHSEKQDHISIDVNEDKRESRKTAIEGESEEDETTRNGNAADTEELVFEMNDANAGDISKKSVFENDKINEINEDEMTADNDLNEIEGRIIALVKEVVNEE